MFTEIIIHHSASDDGKGVDRDAFDKWHREKGWRKIGYHDVIERVDGVLRVLDGRRYWMAGSHTPGHNKTAIGVVLAGNFTEDPPDDEMLEFAASHVAGLCVLGGIPVDNIYPHRHFRQTDCPGAAFPWLGFIQLVVAQLAASEIG